jgi:hypothetical protein
MGEILQYAEYGIAEFLRSTALIAEAEYRRRD